MDPHDMLQFIRSRWSPSKFTEEPVSEEQLTRLFEAARWAPSSYNEQPWFFVVGRKNAGDGAYDKLLSLLVPGNASWAKSAPVLMVSVAKLHFDHNGKPNRHAFHDVGMAVENLILQALSEGLYAHQMGGFYAERAPDVLGMPEGMAPVAMIALGHPAKSERPQGRMRRSISEFVFEGAWNRFPDFFHQQ